MTPEAVEIRDKAIRDAMREAAYRVALVLGVLDAEQSVQNMSISLAMPSDEALVAALTETEAESLTWLGEVSPCRHAKIFLSSRDGAPALGIYMEGQKHHGKKLVKTTTHELVDKP